MKKTYKILVVIVALILFLAIIGFLSFNGTFYYLNAKKHINIKEAEKIKLKEFDSNFIILDYFIQDDTIYYYSKYNDLFSNTSYIYKSDLNNKDLKRVCKLKTNKDIELGYVYKNKLYYKSSSLDSSINHDSVYSLVINSIDLDSCRVKDIYSYKTKVFDNSSFYKDDNNNLILKYNDNAETLGKSYTFVYDMDKGKKVSLEENHLGYNTINEDGKIYYDSTFIYDIGEDINIDILNYNDDYLYYYTQYEKENYIYKLDLNNKVIVNKEKIPSDEFSEYDDSYFYIDKKLYKYNYNNDKLEIVLNKISEDIQYSVLKIINNKYIFTFIDDGVSIAGEDQIYSGRLFIYDSKGKVVFKEKQNEYTNTLRNVIIDNNKVYVIYKDGKVKTIKL